MKSRIIFFLTLIAWIMNIPSALAVECGSVATIQIGSSGPGFETIPTDSATPGLPNFIGKRVELSNYNPKRTDSIQIYADSKNTGANGIDSDDEIEGRYFLSEGYKKDSSSDWIK
ncbi:MAG: hypothetical protein RBS77_05125, partial [Candidatus Moranbacteria bacterium]|nr:hypothetical protein [Candidatus Moranbacteria bacterium]